MINIAILISGRGSNMVSILENLNNHPMANFCLIVSDNPKAIGLTKAKKFNIPTNVIDRALFSTKNFENQLENLLNKVKIDLIVLAGFMQILSSDFIKKFPKILNIHPSLLPKYKGLSTHQRVIENKEAYTGATVHWVSAELDSGPIIKQVQIKVLPIDNADTLAKRLLIEEHRLYVNVLREILDNEKLK